MRNVYFTGLSFRKTDFPYHSSLLKQWVFFLKRLEFPSFHGCITFYCNIISLKVSTLIINDQLLTLLDLSASF